uniref:Elapor1-like galactose binding domain-containing protein n=1 Tax=Meloidogyne javanica TaxID=6303 RepID=A0A915LPR6_MELJA
MNSQKCKLCKPGTFSLGDRVRYEEFELTKLPEGFSIGNSPDESFGGRTIKCSNGGGGWNIEGNQLRYSWTPCVSTLSISLHLTRPGFAEFQYQVSRESKGLIQMLQVRNAQCQSYG